MSETDLLGRAQTLTDAFVSLVESRLDDEALILLDHRAGEQRVTLRALWDAARSVQSTLVARGLVPGDVVVLVLPTSTDLIAAYFGTVLAGGVPSMLSTPSNRVADPRIFTARVAHVVRDSSPHSLICQPDVAAFFDEEGKAALGSAQLITPDDIETPEQFLDPVPCDPETIVTIQYSSGTTGSPKGVLITHRGVVNNLRSMRAAFEVVEGDVAVNWIPLYHDMGLFGAFLLPLLCGCRTVLIPTMDFMRDPAIWLRAIDTYRGTFGWGPNLSYALCAKRLTDEALEGLDLSTWRLALNGSEPVLAPSVDAFAERMAPYGFRPEAMSPAWGLAEATMLGSVQPIHEEPVREVLDRQALSTEGVARPTDGEGVSCVSVGHAIPGCRIEIRDEEGRALPDRHVGRVWLESNALFSGYHGNAEQSGRAMQDGWLDTGDRGYKVGDHFFFIARDKDLIVIGGEKYVPDDLEAAINRVPGVREGCAVVFGILNEERGTDDLGAVVETRETGEAALEDLRRRIRVEVTAVTGLGIRHLILTQPGGIEKSTSGKLARGPTRRRYAAELGIEE